MNKLTFSSLHWLACGDCVEVMKKLPDDSVDSIVTDPPYGIGFMGAQWDESVPSQEFAQQALRVLKPGGHLIAFAASRTVHRLTVALEDAGFEVRDLISWLVFQGIPKSLDISKSIDKLKHNRDEILEVTEWIRDARKAAGLSNADVDKSFGFNGMSAHWSSVGSQPSIPTSDQFIELLELFGKVEPPKRISDLVLKINGEKGKPGENWLKRPVTGKYSIPNGMAIYESKFSDGDDVRHSDGGGDRRDEPVSAEAVQWKGWGTALKRCVEPAILFRKPVSEMSISRNVLKYGTGALNIDACRYPIGSRSWVGPSGEVAGSDDATRGRYPGNVFHCPNPTAEEKGDGKDHPTVKPVELMRWLIKLVTPPGGTVLEPFAGSGTTLVAAHRDNFRVIAIEKEPRFCDIITKRMGATDSELEAVKLDSTQAGF